MPKFFLIAGEASGDLHSAELIHSLKKIYPDSEFVGWGGEKCEAAGMRLLMHYKSVAVMGFVAVLLNFFKFKKLITLAAAQIEAEKPDAVIYTDFSGFNVRVAKRVRHLPHKQVYFIAPKVWAWNQSRVRKFPALFDLMLLILPFEEVFFRNAGCNAVYIGNPSLTEIDAWAAENKSHRNFISSKPLIALLPGSRASEIKHNLPVLASFAHALGDKFDFEIAAVKAHDEAYYRNFMQGVNIPLNFDKTWELLIKARGAIVVSGTATLETALLRTPLVLVYKTSGINYAIAKKLIKIKYLGLGNLVLDKPIIPELIQDCFTVESLKKHALPLFEEGEARSTQLRNFEELRAAFGTMNAPENAAKAIEGILKK